MVGPQNVNDNSQDPKDFSFFVNIPDFKEQKTGLKLKLKVEKSAFFSGLKKVLAKSNQEQS